MNLPLPWAFATLYLPRKFPQLLKTGLYHLSLKGAPYVPQFSCSANIPSGASLIAHDAEMQRDWKLEDVGKKAKPKAPM